jgi:hypothetical protein
MNGVTGMDVNITPAMIDAGALALSEYDRECETLEEAATRIFVAMMMAYLTPAER